MLNLANSYFQPNDTTNAASTYQSLTGSAKPQIRSKAQQQLGILNHKQGKLEEALNNFKQAIKADANNLDARYNYEMLKKKLEEQKKQEQNQQNKDQQQKDQEAEQGSAKQGPAEQRPGEEGSGKERTRAKRTAAERSAGKRTATEGSAKQRRKGEKRSGESKSRSKKKKRTGKERKLPSAFREIRTDENQ